MNCPALMELLEKCPVEFKECVAHMASCLIELQEIWEEVGSETFKRRRIASLIAEEKQKWSKVLSNDIEGKRILYETLKSDEVAIAVLRAELGITEQEPEQIERLPPRERGDCLRRRIEELQELRDDRITEWETLRETEADLCAQLEENVQQLDLRVPTEKQIADLRRRVEVLNRQYEEGRHEFKAIKKDFVKLLNYHSWRPVGTEEMALYEGDESVKLSSEALERYREALRVRKERSDQLREEHSRLLERLTLFWDRFSVADAEQSGFLETNSTYSEPHVKMFQKEVARFEEMKIRKRDVYVAALRRETELLLEQFGLFTAVNELIEEDINELSLDEWENRLSEMKHILEEHRHVFEEIAKRKTLIKGIQEIERRASDPDRLANRGGVLLKDQKERARLQKELNRIDDDIERMLAATEGSGKPVIIWNEPLVNLLRQNSIKDANIKKTPARSTYTPQSTLLTSTLGRKRAPTPSTPMGGSAAKRRLLPLSERHVRQATMTRTASESHIFTTPKTRTRAMQRIGSENVLTPSRMQTPKRTPIPAPRVVQSAKVVGTFRTPARSEAAPAPLTRSKTGGFVSSTRQAPNTAPVANVKPTFSEKVKKVARRFSKRNQPIFSDGDASLVADFGSAGGTLSGDLMFDQPVLSSTLIDS